MNYKWNNPHEWLAAKVEKIEDINEVKNILHELSLKIDGDTSQWLFQKEMDQDGYFKKVNDLTFEFAGIKGELNPGEKENWELIYDGEFQQLWQCRNNFLHEDSFLQEGDLTFEYTYVVNAWFNEEEETWQVDLELVVLPKYLCGPIKKNVLECCGGCEVYDISEYGYGILFGLENDTIDEELDSMIEAAMNSTKFMDMMRGFYLDRPLNMLGTTGWDTIKYLLGLKERLF